MKKRLIDADALMERLERKKCEPAKVRYTEGYNDALMRFRSMVHGAPTVDAVPVVHAYWIIKPHGTYGQLRAFCSACGKHSGIGGIVSNQKKPYCPNCGAIMDGKEIVDG